MTSKILRWAACGLMLLVAAPLLAQTSTTGDTARTVHHTTVHHTTTRHTTTRSHIARTTTHTKKRTTHAAATKTRTTSRAHVRVKRHAEPAAGAHSNAVADSIATKEVINQTPPNDTSAAHASTTTITTIQTVPVNLNTATREQLMTLPGIDAALADRIIAARPFTATTDLTERGLLTPAEYTRIESRITTGP